MDDPKKILEGLRAGYNGNQVDAYTQAKPSLAGASRAVGLDPATYNGNRVDAYSRAQPSLAGMKEALFPTQPPVVANALGANRETPTRTPVAQVGAPVQPGAGSISGVDPRFAPGLSRVSFREAQTPSQRFGLGDGGPYTDTVLAHQGGAIAAVNAGQTGPYVPSDVGPGADNIGNAGNAQPYRSASGLSAGVRFTGNQDATQYAVGPGEGVITRKGKGGQDTLKLALSGDYDAAKEAAQAKAASSEFWRTQNNVDALHAQQRAEQDAHWDRALKRAGDEQASIDGDRQRWKDEMAAFSRENSRRNMSINARRADTDEFQAQQAPRLQAAAHQNARDIAQLQAVTQLQAEGLRQAAHREDKTLDRALEREKYKNLQSNADRTYALDVAKAGLQVQKEYSDLAKEQRGEEDKILKETLVDKDGKTDSATLDLARRYLANWGSQPGQNPNASLQEKLNRFRVQRQILAQSERTWLPFTGASPRTDKDIDTLRSRPATLADTLKTGHVPWGEVLADDSRGLIVRKKPTMSPEELADLDRRTQN